MFVALSAYAPTVLIEESRQQATARARFLARRYGKSFTLTTIPLNVQTFEAPVQRFVNDDPCDECGFGNCIGHAWYVNN